MNRDTKQFIELEKIDSSFEFVKNKQQIIHLFVKGENRSVCTPRRPMGDKLGTIFTSKTTCANCLSKVTGKRFKVKHCR